MQTNTLELVSSDHLPIPNYGPDLQPRVAILVNNPCINDSRVIKEAETLAEQGWDVKVFCRSSNNSANTVTESGVSYLRIPWLNPASLLFQWLRLKRVSNTGKGSQEVSQVSPMRPLAYRVLRFFGRHFVEIYIHLEYKVAIRKFVIEFNPDVIHANDLETLPAATSFARTCSSKIVYDSHEIAIEEYPDQRLGCKLWRKFQERRLIHRADKILTPSEGVSEYLVKRYGVETPTAIYNSPKTKHPELIMLGIRSTLGLSEDTPLIVFTGKLRLDRGMIPMLTALSLCDGFHLARVGPSDDELDFNTLGLAKKLNISERLHLLPAVSPKQVSPFIATADLAVICNLNLSVNFNVGMPNKLFEATFAGLPLAVADLTGIRSFIEKYSLGMVMDQTDPEDIARTFKAVYRDRAMLAPSGDRLAELSRIYGWEAQAAILIKLYNDIGII